MQDQQQAARAELERMAATVTEKERENAKLWEQMRTAASEYHQEFVAKEATIGALIAESEATKQRMQADIDKLRAAMEVRFSLSAPGSDSALLSAFEPKMSAIHMTPGGEARGSIRCAEYCHGMRSCRAESA